MATSSPAPDYGVQQHGMPFVPSNGDAARDRKAQIEAQIAEARRQAELEARKWTRTSRGKWGR